MKAGWQLPPLSGSTRPPSLPSPACTTLLPGSGSLTLLSLPLESTSDSEPPSTSSTVVSSVDSSLPRPPPESLTTRPFLTTSTCPSLPLRSSHALHSRTPSPAPAPLSCPPTTSSRPPHCAPLSRTRLPTVHGFLATTNAVFSKLEICTSTLEYQHHLKLIH